MNSDGNITSSNAPVLDSLSPASAPVNSPAFTLTLHGSNFAAGATVQWGSTSLAPAADGTDKPARPGFSAQLKQAGHGGQSAERDRLVAQARALAARKATLPV